MIRIRFSDATIDRTRIAVSPLSEAVAGLDLVHRQRDRDRAPWPYTDWVERAREVLRTVPETAPLRVYAQLYGTDHGRPTPDVFTPVPLGARPALSEQLEAVRRTPPALAAEQFAKHYPEGLPAFLEPYADRGERAFGLLADALEAFWELALAPYWPAMRAALDEEQLLRARTLATAGPESLLDSLRTPASWDRPVLSLPKPRDSVLNARDQRLLLVPVLLMQDTMTVSTDHPEILMVAYQARGSAVLAGSPAPAPAGRDRLDRLIGPGRAAVLRSLTEPSTTTGLAAALGLAASTISEHLGALVETGSVSRARTGRRVLYARTPAGDSLVALFAEDSASTEGRDSAAAAS
ncbi:transcriptional regulator [Actinoplanes sp. NBRC 14428]|uniref:Regulatory ArsR family protein n=1 Tax=Pseudosporangium ferrugineum TaxID=439699 RepID=A0A2T0SAV9_9ACTN|nr:ArsR family transcriptional regulator [Pseudosporangium ferrugineum]PRY30564.1 regulatory ArsR family protein [Pseudosporangium ferrugineum]BCJ50102.1 transcriptional regulator [Actinoplanes sp. NBRC 14428]